MQSAFLPGLELARRYYAEIVRPLIEAHTPGLRHSAALIGWGSDVLGFDSARSTDHNWGPRCQVFTGPEDAGLAGDLTAMLAAELPASFLGWPTRFADVSVTGEPVRHWVEIAELGSWLTRRLGFDPRDGAVLLDWLATPTQTLAEMTAGAVFHDGLAVSGRSGAAADGSGPAAGGSGLAAARQVLDWYPDDVWRYVLACQWGRIAQEEAFPGRCAEAGDDLGSVVVTARLVRDVMRLALLIRRRYPPYSKWLGTAFARLPGSAALGSLLSGALAASAWPEREQQLCAAYQIVGQMQNELSLAVAVDVSVRPFYDRSYLVIDAGRFVSALRDSTGAQEIRRLPLAGAIDQFVDSTDAIGQNALLRSATAALMAL